MIIDKLVNSATYEAIHPHFKAAFDHIKTVTIDGFTVGTKELLGKSLYVIYQQYNTKPLEQGNWESHRKYIDIQYILEGSELINTACITDLFLGDYNEERDHQKAEGVGAPTVLRAGDFAIFFPQDMHMPCLNPSSEESVKKVVCKVAVLST